MINYEKMKKSIIELKNILDNYKFSELQDLSNDKLMRLASKMEHSSRVILHYYDKRVRLSENVDDESDSERNIPFNEVFTGGI